LFGQLILATTQAGTYLRLIQKARRLTPLEKAPCKPSRGLFCVQSPEGAPLGGHEWLIWEDEFGSLKDEHLGSQFAQFAAPAYVQGVAYMPFARLAAKHILYLTPNGQSTTLSWGAMKAIDESPETQIEHYIVEIKEPNGRWMATGLVLSTEAAEGEAYTFEVDDCQSSSAYRVKGCMASGVIIVTETLR